MLLLAALCITTILGLFDAAYLTYLHYTNVLPPCSIAHGCEIVLTSKYSVIFGIPIAFIGVLFYLAVLILLFFWILTKKRLWSNTLVIITGLDLIAALILVGLQAFILHAYCQYCLASEFIDLLLFILALLVWGKKRKELTS